MLLKTPEYLRKVRFMRLLLRWLCKEVQANEVKIGF
jgi:hypothetical protein